MNNCCKKKTDVLGRNWAKRPNYTKIALYGGHRLSSVRYGVIRYGTVKTVKIALVRRSRTSLTVFLKGPIQANFRVSSKTD